MRELHKSYLAWVVAVTAVVLTAVPAQAFYWRGWPGSRVIVAPTLIPTNDEGNPGNPPQPFPYPGTENNYPPPVGPPGPENVPEPGTGLAGLLGLGAVAVARWVRRKRA
jgi:MYXO-CTERM domain-containing protein